MCEHGRVDVGTAGRSRSDTASRILDAALARFAERGVEATSLDSLAAEIGVRKQTILYWFPSKDQLLLAVIDHAVAELADQLTDAVLGAEPVRDRRVSAAVDSAFRLGRTRPELLAVVREVARAGPGALAHLRVSLDPLLDRAAGALAVDSPGLDEPAARAALVEVGARVVGLATEAELLEALGRPPDLAWLRRRRAGLVADVASRLD